MLIRLIATIGYFIVPNYYFQFFFDKNNQLQIPKKTSCLLQGAVRRTMLKKEEKTHIKSFMRLDSAMACASTY